LNYTLEQCDFETKLAKIFTGALDQFPTVRKTSVSDEINDCPLKSKILGRVTGHQGCCK